MDKPIAQTLDETLKKAGIPITGVSIGDPTDKATWAVRLTTDATAEDRRRVPLIVEALDVSKIPDPVVVPSLEDVIRWAGQMAGMTYDQAVLDIAAVKAGKP